MNKLTKAFANNGMTRRQWKALAWAMIVLPPILTALLLASCATQPAPVDSVPVSEGLSPSSDFENDGAPTASLPANSFPVSGLWSLSYDWECDGVDVVAMECTFTPEGQFTCGDEYSMYYDDGPGKWRGTGKWDGSELTLQFEHGSTYVGTQRADDTWSGMMTNPRMGLGCWMLVKQ